MNQQIPKHAHQPKSLWRTRHGIGLLVLGAVAAFFLLTEHRAHVFGAWPFLLILACPLMHLFMHRGHSAHGHDRGPEHPRIEAEEPGQPTQTNQGDRS